MQYRIYLLALLSLLLAAHGIEHSLNSLAPENLYKKDVIQEYLMSRCILTGDNPYQPLRSLATKYLGVNLEEDWRNDPSAHPSTVVIFAFPMVWMSYATAATLWWTLEVICLVVAIVFVLRFAGFRPSKIHLAIIVGFVLGLPPFYTELYSGQVVILILLFLSLAQVTAQKGRFWLSGILLGLTVLLKLFTWPFLLAAAVSRSWRTFLAGCIVVIVGYGIVAAVFGPCVISDYFLVVAPKLERDQGRHEPTNFSLSAFSWRFFDGTETWGENAISAPPAIDVPALGGRWLTYCNWEYFLLPAGYCARNGTLQNGSV